MIEMIVAIVGCLLVVYAAFRHYRQTRLRSSFICFLGLAIAFVCYVANFVFMQIGHDRVAEFFAYLFWIPGVILIIIGLIISLTKDRWLILAEYQVPRAHSKGMNRAFSKLVDVFGKVMLGWFVFSTIRYFYYGRFGEEIRMILPSFHDGLYWWFVYRLIQVPFSAIGIFIIIPLLLKGRMLGLVLGVLYWILGYPTNPLSFIVPYKMQVDSSGGPSIILLGINLFYGIITLVVLVLFYLHRKTLFAKK
jgi:hypothetical protein